eukprot:scaffold3277_cov218-Pinguiococcus_pyrenoidosus.AAC.6
MSGGRLGLLVALSSGLVARSDWIDHFHRGLRDARDALLPSPPTDVEPPARRALGGCDAFSTCQSCLASGGSFGSRCTWCADEGVQACRGSFDYWSSRCSGPAEDLGSCTPLATTRRPVIIIPGLIGSVIEARLDKQEVSFRKRVWANKRHAADGSLCFLLSSESQIGGFHD